MSAQNYLDFDLQIDEMEEGTFRVRVLNSPAGQAEAAFDFPFSDLELENFFLRIGRPRRGLRRIDSPEMYEARKFGSKLYKAVFQDALQACLLRSIDQAEQQGNGLRVRLRLPPSLTDIPWEYLYDSSLDRFFSHSTSTPLVRYLDLTQSIKPLSVTPPLKVLAMIANPSDKSFESLDVEAEWQKIEKAVDDLKRRGLIQLTRLPDATLSTLQKQLRREQYHIFHFVGHGGFDQQTQDGVLLLEDENGRSRLISGNTLGTLLHDHASLRLALLNACEGARGTRSDPFAGVAQQLVRQGIPAVIAMQFEITDRAAIQLSQEFYDALADGYPVDGALAEARKAIFAAGNDIEWGTPVLYLRAADSRLFDIATVAKSAIHRPEDGKNRPLQQPGQRAWRWSFLFLALPLLIVLLLVVWQPRGLSRWLGGGLTPPTPTSEQQGVTPSPAATATVGKLKPAALLLSATNTSPMHSPIKLPDYTPTPKPTIALANTATATPTPDFAGLLQHYLEAQSLALETQDSDALALLSNYATDAAIAQRFVHGQCADPAAQPALLQGVTVQELSFIQNEALVKVEERYQCDTRAMPINLVYVLLLQEQQWKVDAVTLAE